MWALEFWPNRLFENIRTKQNCNLTLANFCLSFCVGKTQAEAKKLEDSSLYLNLPATKMELEEKGYSATGKSTQSLGNCTISKDFFQISTLVCSTKLTQNGKSQEVVATSSVFIQTTVCAACCSSGGAESCDFFFSVCVELASLSLSCSRSQVKRLPFLLIFTKFYNVNAYWRQHIFERLTWIKVVKEKNIEDFEIGFI